MPAPARNVFETVKREFGKTKRGFGKTKCEFGKTKSASGNAKKKNENKASAKPDARQGSVVLQRPIPAPTSPGNSPNHGNLTALRLPDGKTLTCRHDDRDRFIQTTLGEHHHHDTWD